MDTKPFISINEQIQRLVTRGLEIKDKESVRFQLLKTTYYDLINGYKDMFLMPKTSVIEDDKYITGTHFEDLFSLYSLDRELRSLIMKASLDVESNFYSTLSYAICNKYGERQENYLKKENYKIGKLQSKRVYERDRLLNRINTRINDSNEHPIKHYKEQYGNIPPWILVKHLTFGEIIVWYKVCPADVKNDVVSFFTGLEPTNQLKETFVKSLELINKFRNRAAHGGRIYNYRTNVEIPFDEDIHLPFYITKEKYTEGTGQSDFSAFILCILYLYQNDKSELIEKVVTLHHVLERYKKQSPVHYYGVLEELKLPEDYYEILHESILGRKPTVEEINGSL